MSVIRDFQSRNGTLLLDGASMYILEKKFSSAEDLINHL